MERIVNIENSIKNNEKQLVNAGGREREQILASLAIWYQNLQEYTDHHQILIDAYENTMNSSDWTPQCR